MSTSERPEPKTVSESQIIQTPKGEVIFAARRQSIAADSIYSYRNPLISILPSRIVEPGPWLTQAIIAANQIEDDVDQVSVIKAFLNAASLGLMVGSAFSHCWPVPFKDNNDRGTKKAQLIVGYQGYQELAFRNGYLKRLNMNLVMKGEKLKIWNDERGNHIEHEQDEDRDETDEKNIRGAYCTWTVEGGFNDAKYCSRAVIEKSIPRHQSDAWKKFWGSMAIRVPIKRAAKSWHKGPSGDLSRAMHIDDQADRGVDQDYLVDAPKERTNQNMDRIVETDICGKESAYEKLKTVVANATNAEERDAALIAIQAAEADKSITSQEADALAIKCDEIPF